MIRTFDARHGLRTILATALALLGVSSAAAAVVETTQPKQTTLRRSTTQPATIHAYFEAGIHAKVTGYLKSISADLGDTVKAGQTLATIDIPEMVKGLESQKAEVDRLESARKQYRAAIDVAKAKVEQAKADIGKAKAQADADQLEYDRIAKLVETKAVTQKLLDESLSRKLASEADLASMKASESVAVASLRASEADAASADAAAVVASKRFEEMQVMVDYATLKAPFAGIVTERNIDPGDLVQAASGKDAMPLYGVAQVDKMRVRVAIPERDAIYVNVGDAAELNCKAIGATIKTQVARIARRLDPQTRTMMVELDVPNADGRLIPGMYGTVTILLEEKQNAIVVPSGSVRFDASGDQSVVYVVQGNKVSHVAVKLGYDDGHTIEILSGLTGGEQIVTSMLERLNDGDTVTLK